MEDLREKIIDSIEPVGKKRSRYEVGGRGIPSVTEILSYVDSQGLIDWANRIGLQGKNNKEYAAKAARYGTATHSAIENYLKGNGNDFLDNSAFKAFKLWWADINRDHKVKIIGQEEPLVIDTFAGTYDLLITIDDRYFMIDFKTSNSVGYKYFMQLAAYRYLIYRKKGIVLDGVIVLQLDKAPRAPKYYEFGLDFSRADHYAFIENCMNCFAGVLYSYHNIERLKNEFDEVFYGDNETRNKGVA